MCAEEVKAAAVLCRFCGHRFLDQGEKPGSLPSKPDGRPPDLVTKHLDAGCWPSRWSRGCQFGGRGYIAVTSDRVLFVELGGFVWDQRLAVERRVSVAGQNVDVWIYGTHVQYRGFHPEVAKEIAATIVPGLIDKLCEGDPEIRTTLRSRHERVARSGQRGCFEAFGHREGLQVSRWYAGDCRAAACPSTLGGP